MSENQYQKVILLLLFSPAGSIGLFLLSVGVIGIFIYLLNAAYNPGLFLELRPWLLPAIISLIGLGFLYLSISGIMKKDNKFLEDIKKQKIVLLRKLEDIEKGEFSEKYIPTSSEFGVNDLDLEIINLIKENGGVIPLLHRDIENSPISYEEAIKSLAKLEVMGYVKIPGNRRGQVDRIILTVKALEILEIPRISFTAMIPEDISLMLIHAHILYRKGEFETAMAKCYNAIERALKIHLIPSIDDYVEKWNREHPDSEKMWRGNNTKWGANSLFNFYKKNVEMDKKVKEFVEKAINYIAEVRSRYSHDKPSEKRTSDAHRVLTLTELVLGMMFENLKEQAGMKSAKISSFKSF